MCQNLYSQNHKRFWIWIKSAVKSAVNLVGNRSWVCCDNGTWAYGIWVKMKRFTNFVLQCESGFIESPLSEISFLISLVWAGGGIDVGDPMLKIEKCCEGDRAPPTPQKWENKFRNIWLSMIKESYGNPSLERNVCSNWHYEVHPLITFVTVIFVHVIAKITFYESKSQTSSKTFPENSVFGIMSLTVSLENSSMRILWVPI